MKTSFARALVIAGALVLTAAAGPAAAWEPPGVLRTPVDPWNGWGRPAPSASVTYVVPGVPSIVAPAPQPVWVPGFWAWNGFTWVWVPSHWSW